METGGNILVVDDNKFLRIVVSKMLSLLGYDVLSTDSGENGLSLFLKNKFDIWYTLINRQPKAIPEEKYNQYFITRCPHE